MRLARSTLGSLAALAVLAASFLGAPAAALGPLPVSEVAARAAALAAAAHPPVAVTDALLASAAEAGGYALVVDSHGRVLVRGPGLPARVRDPRAVAWVVAPGATTHQGCLAVSPVPRVGPFVVPCPAFARRLTRFVAHPLLARTARADALDLALAASAIAAAHGLDRVSPAVLALAVRGALTAPLRESATLVGPLVRARLVTRGFAATYCVRPGAAPVVLARCPTAH